MRTPYDSISIVQEQKGSIIDTIPLIELYKALPEEKGIVKDLKGAKDEASRYNCNPEKIYDLRGKISVYLKQTQGKGYAKVVMEPDELEQDLEIAVEKEIKVKDFKNLIEILRKIKD